MFSQYDRLNFERLCVYVMVPCICTERNSLLVHIISSIFLVYELICFLLVHKHTCFHHFRMLFYLKFFFQFFFLLFFLIFETTRVHSNIDSGFVTILCCFNAFIFIFFSLRFTRYV